MEMEKNEMVIKEEALTEEDNKLIDSLLKEENTKTAVISNEGVISDEEINEKEEETLSEITPEDIANGNKLLDATGEVFSKNEAIALFDVIRRIKSGENFSVYNALPKSLQDNIKKTAYSNGIVDPKGIRMFARVIIDQIAQETQINKEWEKFSSELKKANESMPEYMDIFGESLYKNMVYKNLANANMLMDKNNKHDADILVNIAKIYIDMYFFKCPAEAIRSNRSAAKKYRKHIDRFIGDLEYKLPRVGIRMSHNTRITVLYKSICKIMGVQTTNKIIAAYAIMMTHSVDDSVFYKEKALLIHQFLCILSGITESEKENRTDHSTTLIDNIERFAKYYDTLIDNNEDESIFTEIVNESSKHFDKVYAEAKEHYQDEPEKRITGLDDDENIFEKCEEEDKKENETKPEWDNTDWDNPTMCGPHED